MTEATAQMKAERFIKRLEATVHQSNLKSIIVILSLMRDTWERRTAIVSTLYFIGKGDVADAFKIAEILLKDDQDLVHKGMGWALRYAGDKDRQKLLSFLEKHAATMPRTALRYAIEHLDKKKRDHYLSMKKVASLANG